MTSAAVESPNPQGRLSRRWLLGVAFLAVIAFAAEAWLILARRHATPNRPAPIHEPVDPRVTFPTRYRNVRPDVGYVGSERCVACHREIAAKYRQHPMGQSMAALDGGKDRAELAPKPWQEFDALGLHYRIEEKDGQIWHIESKRDAQGKDVAAQAEPVKFVIGSGTRGRSYLIDRDGFLFQSPISWFGEEKRWDLSPGYQKKHSHFDRPIPEACLFCHANQVEAIRETVNRFRPLALNDLAIGCERCHGPGELHVRRQELNESYEGVDDTIVQPAHLEPMLRDAVCEQCHLQGEMRILRNRRNWFEYRPGLPLHAFATTFVRRPEFVDMQKSVGQVEQLTTSRCYLESRGKMGCISCHDPHAAPTAADKERFFRSRCLNCHDAGAGKVGCRLPLDQRQKRGDSCIGCHMTRRDSGNVVHVSITDHRILRRPEAGSEAKGSPYLGPQDLPWRPFHPPGQQEAADQDRDMGIALAKVAVNQRLAKAAQLALPRLTAATRRDPQDLEAWHARANALFALQEFDEALATAKTALALAPNNETLLLQTAFFSMPARALDAHMDAWHKLVKINPQTASHYVDLTNAFAMRSQWADAAGAAEKGLRLNAVSADLRTALIQALLRTGQRERAERELEVLRGLAPKNLADVERWFGK